MSLVDPDRVADLLLEVADTEVTPRFRHLAKGEISEKTGGELVTVADVAAERALAPRLIELLPGSLVVGEEAVAEDPRILERLKGEAPVWVIDPIDGTGNFARGDENFALQVALVRRGRTEAGWIHAPILKRMAVVVRGGGVVLDGRKAHIDAVDLAPAELMGTLHAGQFSTPEMAKQMQDRRGRVAAQKSRSAASIEYLRLLGREMHFSLFTKLKPWDHAPGCLMLVEAGGVARFTDTEANYSPLRHEGEGLLLAPDAESWKKLREALLPR